MGEYLAPVPEESRPGLFIPFEESLPGRFIPTDVIGVSPGEYAAFSESLRSVPEENPNIIRSNN